MIKQIQLRGITRTPSDRATADGGCAESLNVHLDQQEIAPTLPPDATNAYNEVYRTATYKYPIVYVHKMVGVTNYIGQIYGGVQFRAYGSTLDAEGDTLEGTTLGTGETVMHISSVGNMLIIFSKKNDKPCKPYYFLFKNGAYDYLGNAIPRPHLEFITKQEAFDATSYNYYSPLSALAQVAEGSLRATADMTTWNKAADPDDANHAELLETMDNVWDTVTKLTGKWRNKGVFYAPFFIRYALRLYDGSYIYSSVPILCGAGSSAQGWLRIFVQGWESNDVYPDYEGHLIRCSLRNPYYLHVRGSFSALDWGDIVKSIDIFASSPIYAPAWESGFSSAFESEQTSEEKNLDFILEGMNTELRDTTVRDEVLSKGQFYKIKTIDINDTNGMAALRGGYMKIEASDEVSGEKLATHDTMPESYRDGSQYIPMEGARNYNNRLMLVGANELLSRGDTFMNGLVTGTALSTFSTRRYSFRYKIVDPATGDAHYVNAHYLNDGTMIYPGYITNTTTGQYQQFGNVSAVGTGATPYYPSDPWSWLCYPDTRCKEVEVFFYDTYGIYVDSRKVPMEPHPLLECSFAFLGFDKSLLSLYAPGTPYAQGVESDLAAEESLSISAGNKIFLSEFENPFLYPAGNIVTLPDLVVDAAVTSVPLSEGQYGEFTMYVFTEGGIRVLGVNSVGTFSANMVHPNLSRHVALRGTVMSMEQAVIFATKRGVMMLTGNQITEISQTINGKPYALAPAGLTSVLNGSAWSGLVPTVNATETLMQFMSTAKPAYDHNGARIIFFNPTKDYQYVFMLETQTWHKIQTGILGGTILNSYPRCLVSYTAGTNNTTYLYDFSTVLDNASYLSSTVNPVKGIIVTRPLDLGEPDIRKAIRSIRIRGNYNRGDVKYLLLGSFDGINWKLERTLRGGSFKMFRLVILTNLSPTERITWIDVDYESRFTNRLR